MVSVLPVFVSVVLDCARTTGVRKGLYTERSHCHIVLINYETLLLDLHHFKEIYWLYAVYDEPWGLFANEKYAPAQVQIHALVHSRQKIFCSSPLLRHNHSPDEGVQQRTPVLPNTVDVTRNVFPYAIGVAPVSTMAGRGRTAEEETAKGAGTPQLDLDATTRSYLTKLLAGVTAVCVDEEIKADDAMFRVLSQLEWSGVQLASNDQMLSEDDEAASVGVYKFSTTAATETTALRLYKNVVYSQEYTDAVLDKELRLLKLSSVGVAGNIPRIHYDHDDFKSSGCAGGDDADGSSTSGSKGTYSSVV